MEFEALISEEDVVNSYQHIKNTIKEEKFIDTKFLYLHSQSVENWSKYEETDENNPYSSISSASKGSLENLIKDEEFKEHIKEISTIVDLGIGKGSKSELILEHLNEIKGIKLKEFYCFDFSLAMIAKSYKNLQAVKNKDNFNLDIDIKGYKGDFMRINKTFFNNSNRKENVLFMLLGGTIGNVDEKTFLSNLAETMNTGDLGIITFFKIKDMDIQEEEKNNTEEVYIKAIYEVYGPTLEDMGYNLTDINVLFREEKGQYLDILVKVGLEDLTTGNYIDDVEILHSKRYLNEYIKNLLEEKDLHRIIETKDEKELTTSILFKKNEGKEV